MRRGRLSVDDKPGSSQKERHPGKVAWRCLMMVPHPKPAGVTKREAKRYGFCYRCAAQTFLDSDSAPERVEAASLIRLSRFGDLSRDDPIRVRPCLLPVQSLSDARKTRSPI